jgi:hypothetical protein
VISSGINIVSQKKVNVTSLLVAELMFPPELQLVVKSCLLMHFDESALIELKLVAHLIFYYALQLVA